VLAAKRWLQLFDSVDVDNGRTMNPDEAIRIELHFNRAQSTPHHVCAFADMNMNVFVVGFYPIDLASVQKNEPAIALDHKSMRTALPRANGTARHHRSAVDASKTMLMTMKFF